MKKSINIEVSESGNKFFYIYEIRVKKQDWEFYTYDRELNRKSAEETADFLRRTSDLFVSAWVREQIVWC